MHFLDITFHKFCMNKDCKMAKNAAHYLILSPFLKRFTFVDRGLHFDGDSHTSLQLLINLDLPLEANIDK